MVGRELQAEAVRLLVLLRAMLRTRRGLNTIESRCTRCDGSLPSPLHLAIKRISILMMFPPAATWTRAVGLRGLKVKIYNGNTPKDRDNRSKRLALLNRYFSR